jgi:hypothetical protein
MSDADLTKPVQHLVLGEESMANLRLFEILTNAFGKPNVERLLELRHLSSPLKNPASRGRTDPWR